jgi:hypothetical protein
MNPIPPSFPDYNPPARATPPASNVDNAERVQQFEQMLDRKNASSTERSPDHPHHTSSKETDASKEAGRSKKSDSAKESDSSKEPQSGISTKKTKHAESPDSTSPLSLNEESEIAHDSEEGDSQAVDAESDSLSSLEPTGTVLADAVHARKKRGQGEDEPSGDGSQAQYGGGVPVPVDRTPEVSLSEISHASATEAVGRIEQISTLIAQTAQKVTFEGNDRATITLSPDQLPDSKLIIQMTQQVVQVTFLSDNASSLALLQARGGEVAAALAMRFDKEIRIEVKDGGDGSDAGDSGTTRASWAIQGNSGSGSTSANA